MKPMFEEDDFFRLATARIGQLDPSLIAQNDLIVLHSINEIPSGLAQSLEQFVKAGGSLLLFPGAEIDLNSYGRFMVPLGLDKYLSVDTTRSRVSDIDIRSAMFKDLFEQLEPNVDLPKVTRHYRTENSMSSGRIDLMSLQNGQAFLSNYAINGGSVYMSAVPLDQAWSNLTRHAFFVAIVLRAAELSTPSGRIYYTIGSDEAIEIDDPENDVAPLHISNETDIDMIPELRRSGNKAELFVHDLIEFAGNYSIDQEDVQVGSVSFNYDRSSSPLDLLEPEALMGRIEESGKEGISILELTDRQATAGLIKEIDEGKHLWRWFIALALIFLGLETALIRFWK